MKKIEEMTVEELRARRAEIRTELEKPDADLDALEQEQLRSLRECRFLRRKSAEKELRRLWPRAQGSREKTR